MSADKDRHYLDKSEVKIAAIRRGVSIADALRQSSIPRSTFESCTSGLLRMRIERIEDLASVLHVVPEDIITMDRPQRPEGRQRKC